MRAALLLALWLPLASLAGGVGVPASDFGEVNPVVKDNPVPAEEAAAPGEKSPEQLHSPMLVYDQPVPAPVVAANEPEEETRTDKPGMKLSVPLGGGGVGGSSAGRPQRTGPGSSGNTPPDYSPPNPAPPDSPPPPPYGGGNSGEGGDASPRQFTASADPCTRDGYHDTVMKKGLDVARMNCQLHQLDKNRWALWGLAGGDPLKHWVMQKQLDKALDVFKVK